MNTHTRILFAAVSAFLFVSCGGLRPFSEPPITATIFPEKTTPLTQEELKVWGHLDMERDTVPGMSVERTYRELIGSRPGETVIVGVIDSGVDIEHEDLKNVLWINSGEVPDNGVDDDNNGYIDDRHGWNFLGDIIGENMEFVRILKQLESRFDGKDESEVAEADQADFALYQEVKSEYLKEKQEALQGRFQFQTIQEQLSEAHEAVCQLLEKEDYTAEDLDSLQGNAEVQAYLGMLNYMLTFNETIPEVLKEVEEGLEYYTGKMDNHLNKEGDYRAVLGDDLNNLSDNRYGNNQLWGPDPEKKDAKHGTHVAGIIAAQRNNGIGMDGVAQNVQILTVRAVPDGDEYDKDIALAIRYAVDNGAKVLNTSFGKYYSTHPEWVYDALRYAAEKDVLIVNAAGNDSYDLDTHEKLVYPNDQTDNHTEIVDNFLTVGALNFEYGEELVAVFSNYGKSNVDVFAPGVKIWATTPNDEYEFLQGTSMASPGVAGVAAMLRSYFPNLTAAQVKKVLMDSGLALDKTVIVGGDPDNKKPFSELSKSGRMVNMYNAFIMANKM